MQVSESSHGLGEDGKGKGLTIMVMIMSIIGMIIGRVRGDLIEHPGKGLR